MEYKIDSNGSTIFQTENKFSNSVCFIFLFIKLRDFNYNVPITNKFMDKDMLRMDYFNSLVVTSATNKRML